MARTRARAEKTATEYFLRAPGYAPASETAGGARLAYANLEIPLAATPAALRLDATGALQPVLDHAQGARFAQYRWRGWPGRDAHWIYEGNGVGVRARLQQARCLRPGGRRHVCRGSGYSKTDALSWYAVEFADLGLSNGHKWGARYSTQRIQPSDWARRAREFRALFLRRDTTADFREADSAEAGLFQSSFGARVYNSNMMEVYLSYKGRTDFLDIFKEGAGNPDAENLRNWGTGEGANFQALSKSCPAFAAEYAALCLRYHRAEYGTIRDKKVEVSSNCDAFLRGIENIMRATISRMFEQPECRGEFSWRVWSNGPLELSSVTRRIRRGCDAYVAHCPPPRRAGSRPTSAHKAGAR